MTEWEFFLVDLESRFKGIDKSKYYLSYSGGKDSHFLYWFIREYMHDREIEIVSVNTYMEHPQIRQRIYKNADTVLLPPMKPFDIKEQFGSPCFSKIQDEWIERYQNGQRYDWLMKRIFDGDGNYHKFALSKKARKLLLTGNLHRISPKCCKYLKKEPARLFEKKTGKKPIFGVRGGESQMRKVQYTSCFTKDGKFSPIHDMTDEMLEMINRECNIEVPQIYECVSRTGCMGCPYGSYKHDTEKELLLLNENQRNFVMKYFNESYRVLGIIYEPTLF